MADVGCATGYLLNFFKQLGHSVTGSEYTVTFRRMAEHYYGIPVSEELDTQEKYDLITIYHVLEHMVEPDKKLSHYASLLSDDGNMLVSVPEWFNFVEEASGNVTSNFEHWFHKDHINIFSAASVSNLFRKSGLIIVKEDHEQYGQTYLLRKARTGELPKDWMVKESWTEQERYILRAKVAIELFAASKFREALEVEPKFPEAWIAIIFGKAAKDPSRQADLFAEAEKHIGKNKRFLTAKAQWHYQREELQAALDLFHKVVSIRPNEDIFIYMGYAYAKMNKPMEAIQCFHTANNMDPRKWGEAQSWILNLVSQQPAWDERALAEAKELIYKDASTNGKLNPKLSDMRQANEPQTPAAQVK